MRRRVTAALLAAGLGLLTTGCGVQPTGVNVAQSEPFTPSGSNSTQSPSQSAAQYQMVLYFMPVTNGLPRQTVRSVSRPVTGINDLLQQLKHPNDNTLVTWIPPDLQLIPTDSAHEYKVSTQYDFNTAAEEQLACTFSYYWREHPDKGAEPSIAFNLPSGIVRGWYDCAYLLGPAEKVPSVQPTGN